MRCPYGRCAGDGWLIDERTRSASECECMPEQKAARVAGSLRARIPREYQDASFQHTNISGLPRDAVSRVRGYVDTLDERLAAGDGLWISGSIGTGKTWLAMLVARYAIERGNGVAVYSVPRLLSEIRRTYDGEGTTTLDLLDQLTEVSLLVLDDVGTERSNPWVLEQLYTIINERWQERRAIVLTTNLDPMQMQDQIGERAVSRLVGMCETVLIDGVDHRQPDPGGHHAASRGVGGPPRQAGGAFANGPAAGGSGPGFSGGQGPGPSSGGGFPGPRSGGPLGPPPPLDPEAAAWAARTSDPAPPRLDDGAPRFEGEAPRFDGEAPRYDPPPATDDRAAERPPGSADGFGAPPPARTFGADPRDLRRPERRVFDDRDRR